MTEPPDRNQSAVRAAARWQLIIFDFDGTLADSFNCFLDACDAVAQRFRIEKLDRTQLQMLRGLEVRQLLTRFRVPLWRFPAVLRYTRSRLQQHIGEIHLFPGMDRALETLALSGATLSIVSSNSLQNVTQVLGEQNAACFRYLECGTALSSKPARLRRVLARSQVPRDRAIFIGDEVRDACAAAEAGIAFGAVGWGYTRLEALLSHNPRETFASIEDLVRRRARVNRVAVTWVWQRSGTRSKPLERRKGSRSKPGIRTHRLADYFVSRTSGAATSAGLR